MLIKVSCLYDEQGQKYFSQKDILAVLQDRLNIVLDYEIDTKIPFRAKVILKTLIQDFSEL